MQGRVGELHLRLHAHGSDNPQPRRRLDQVLQQCGLPDARLAEQQQHAAFTLAYRRDYAFEQG
jgi:hypothetical protein